MVRWSRFNIASIVLGFAFLYLPILLLVVFSFNMLGDGLRDVLDPRLRSQ